MPRAVKPETAAKRIVDLIASKQASSADDAIRQHPELAPGKALLEQAATGVAQPAASAPAQPAPRPRGSGPALTSR